MGRVDDNHVDPGLEQRVHPLLPVRPHPHRGPHPQAAELVLAGVGVLLDLLDVLDGDEPLEVVVIVHHQELFDAVLVQEGLGLPPG